MKLCLLEVIKELEIIKEIEIEDKLFNIKWTQGGDLKWLANIHGLNAANSEHPCIWCNWSFKQTDHKALNADERTHQRCRDKLQRATKNTDGYQNIPLLRFIEFKNAIFDPLHMCLRITDNLFEKLIAHFDFLDKDGSFDLEKRKYLRILTEFIENNCKVSSPFFYCEKEKKVKIRNLNQRDRFKILKGLETRNLINLFPELKRDNYILGINFVLLEFYNILKLIKRDYNVIPFDKNELKIRIDNWLQYYIKINGSKKLTPYIHILTTHVISFIEEFKNLNVFSPQSLQHLNSIYKINYLRQTNKKGNFFLVQL